MDLRTGSVASVGALTAALVLAACGGGDDSAQSSPGASAAPSAAASTTGRPTATKAPKPAKTAAAATVAAPAAKAIAPKPVVTPKATADPKKPAYRVAMPDGRTAPLSTDWKFTKLVLDKSAFAVGGTVDVTYNGPGLASMGFTAVVTYATGVTLPSGEAATDTAELRGSVAAMRAGATETVRLLGGKETSFLDPDQPYKGEYTVDSFSDDDPKARAD